MTESDGGAYAITCTEAQEDALAFLGSELSEEQERQVMAHLGHCEKCRKEFHKDVVVWRMLAACPPLSAGTDFDAMLNKRIANEDRNNPNPIEVELANARSDITPNPPARRANAKRTRKEHP